MVRVYARCYIAGYLDEEPGAASRRRHELADNLVYWPDQIDGVDTELVATDGTLSQLFAPDETIMVFHLRGYQGADAVDHAKWLIWTEANDCGIDVRRVEATLDPRTFLKAS